MHAGEVNGFFGGLVVCLLFLAEGFLAETAGEQRYMGEVVTKLLKWQGGVFGALGGFGCYWVLLGDLLPGY